MDDLDFLSLLSIYNGDSIFKLHHQRRKTTCQAMSQHPSVQPNQPNQLIRMLPEHVWWQSILQPFFNHQQLALLRQANSFFEEYYQHVLQQRTIHVPHDVQSLQEAACVATMWSKRMQLTQAKPLLVVLSEGLHDMVGVQNTTLDIPCDNIVFRGQGKTKTTIGGGFKMDLIPTDAVLRARFESLTVRNPQGNGLEINGGPAAVCLFECAIHDCGKTGVVVSDSATMTATHCHFVSNQLAGVYCVCLVKVKFNNCTMSSNKQSGLTVNESKVDINGEHTSIHSNGKHGIRACNNGKVNIHLPLHHKTTHSNAKQDQFQSTGGSIQYVTSSST